MWCQKQLLLLQLLPDL
jgi:hypothetical protein